MIAEDLSRMGRDTIAGLIAGIIQRNSISNEVRKNQKLPCAREKTDLLNKLTGPTNFGHFKNANLWCLRFPIEKTYFNDPV